jgi:hypothetical protein
MSGPEGAPLVLRPYRLADVVRLRFAYGAGCLGAVASAGQGDTPLAALRRRCTRCGGAMCVLRRFVADA